jgi:hypothetical protein
LRHDKFKTRIGSGADRGNACSGSAFFAGSAVVGGTRVCVAGVRAGLAPVLAAWFGPVVPIIAVALATAAFVVSWKHRSFLVAGLLAASGIIFMVASVIATEYFAVIVVPGPILGVIFGLGILGLGLAKGIRTAKTAVITAS